MIASRVFVPISIAKFAMSLKDLLIVSIACCALLSGAVQATPLRLDYVVSNAGGGQYDYEFKLTLDNHDSSWAAGQGWTWLTFGDASSAPSPLSSFVGDSSSLPVGPWTSYNFSGGGHNGPTFLFGNAGVEYWTPDSVGSYLTWSGTAAVDLSNSGLLFSTLWTSNGAVAADFEMANRVASFAAPVPEPETYASLLAGLGLLALARRKARTRT